MKLAHTSVRGAGIEVHAWGSDRGLVAVFLGPVPGEGVAPGSTPVPGVEIADAPPFDPLLREALEAYLRGAPLEWDGALDVRGLTGFRLEVYAKVRAIPHGEIRTYGDVARDVGRPQALRAVGNALHHNPFPVVVPCHRVVREGGALGGFSAGPSVKRALLALEAGQLALDWEEDR